MATAGIGSDFHDHNSCRMAWKAFAGMLLGSPFFLHLEWRASSSTGLIQQCISILQFSSLALRLRLDLQGMVQGSERCNTTCRS